jgi:hypothetical protein
VPRLVTEPPEGLHVLSLMVRDRIGEALRTVEGRDRARRLQGRIGLAAGGMHTRLAFDGRTIHLDQGPLEETQARASGTLASFLAICQGKVRVGDVLRRQVRMAGNPLLLRRFLPLLSAGVPDEHEEQHP